MAGKPAGQNPFEAVLVLPNQLFHNHPSLKTGRPAILLEDSRFFADTSRGVRFHKMKLVLHRASMTAYREHLKAKGHAVRYVSWAEDRKTEDLFQQLAAEGLRTVYLAEPADNALEAELGRLASIHGIALRTDPSPAFLTQPAWFRDFFQGVRHYSMTTFYIAQRRRLDLLLNDGRPEGGRWTFDTQNRKRLPKGIRVPPLERPAPNRYVEEAKASVKGQFPLHPGDMEGFCYAVTSEEARRLFHSFLEQRLPFFGDYEDAISREESFLFHAVLTPALNTGLITPGEVLDDLLAFRDAHPGLVPLNAMEGFLRQLVGWREFMRAVYVLEGDRQRSSNFWNHLRPIPEQFYRGTTGIEPVDGVIRRVLKLGYVHHIERLMVLGNFMLLCEINPSEVYRWFMEMFVDAYDWVMVPNVYGMSQYADGGLITTKPYISSSHYILKMSDYKAGDWCEVWDGLYWRFVENRRQFFRTNPRMSVMVRQLDRMDSDKRKKLAAAAESFLRRLWP